MGRINPKNKLEGIVKGFFDQNTDLVIDFDIKSIYLDKDGEITPVLEAAPEMLLVTDDFMAEIPRQFEIYWRSSLSKRILETNGSLPEIEDFMIKGGWSNHPEMLPAVLPTVINTLIDANMAIIITRGGD